MALPDTEVQMLWGFAVMPVAEEPALATLERIAAETLGRALLCWIPLMQGGTDPKNIAEWIRLAGLETDEHRRRVYGIVALTFAELTDNPAVWQKALEGWGVEKSALWERIRKEGQAEARLEGRLVELRAGLLRILRKRFDPLPEDLLQAIQVQQDPDVLNRATEVALDAASLEPVKSVLSVN
jgi:hypothetical protein